MALARRDYLNNPDALAKMTEVAHGLGRLANIPAESTRGYGMSDLHRAMMAAASLPSWRAPRMAAKPSRATYGPAPECQDADCALPRVGTCSHAGERSLGHHTGMA
jgi:hypothetical protein